VPDKNEWPTSVATVAGWSGVVSLNSGREGWHGYARGQVTVYHRLGEQYDPMSPSVTITTFQFPEQRRDQSAFITETFLLNELLWRWADDEPVAFPIEIRIERSTPQVVIDDETSSWLVLNCNRLWVAGLELADVAVMAVGRNLGSHDVVLRFTPLNELHQARE